MEFENDQNWSVIALLNSNISSNTICYDESFKHTPLVKGSTLLHWAAAFDAIDSAKVMLSPDLCVCLRDILLVRRFSSRTVQRSADRTETF